MADKSTPRENQQQQQGVGIELSTVVVFTLAIVAVYFSYQFGVVQGYKHILNGTAVVRDYKGVSGTPCKAVLVKNHHRSEKCEGEGNDPLGGGQ